MKNLVKFCYENDITPIVHYNCSLHKWGHGHSDNVVKHWTNTYNDVLNGKRSASDFFHYAFSWEHSNQGFEFWNVINNKWKKYCKENNVKYLIQTK